MNRHRGGRRPGRVSRVMRYARNALIFYLLSRPLRRTINPRREAMRRRYARPRGTQLLGWLLGRGRAV